MDRRGIHQVEEDDGLHFLVMELAEGEDLAQRLARTSLSVGEALTVAFQIAAALEAAHEKGIVHRDLKPANVMVADSGQTKVLDFGLAKAWEVEPGEADSLSPSPTLTAQMTQAGVILGTAAYMSPQQARGYEVDKQADIWAFGCVLYEMLAGKRTFRGETVTDTLAAILERSRGGAIGPLPRTAISADLGWVGCCSSAGSDPGLPGETTVSSTSCIMKCDWPASVRQVVLPRTSPRKSSTFQAFFLAVEVFSVRGIHSPQ